MCITTRYETQAEPVHDSTRDAPRKAEPESTRERRAKSTGPGLGLG
jgi:hypothetical protein